MKPEPLGHTFPVLLLFTTVFTVWLGILGPVNLGALKEWQTLMAAMVALVAASIAYRGAMAKVYLDRELAERKNAQEKLSLYLKLGFALTELSAQADIIQKKTAWTIGYRKPPVEKEEMEIREPPEVAEAWDKLEALPVETIAAINIVRSSIRACAATLNKHPPKTAWPVDFDVTGVNPTSGICKLAAEITKASNAAAKQLALECQEVWSSRG